MKTALFGTHHFRHEFASVGYGPSISRSVIDEIVKDLSTRLIAGKGGSRANGRHDPRYEHLDLICFQAFVDAVSIGFLYD